MHEVEVDIVGLEVFQRRSNALRNTLVPRVVQLGGEPDLAARHTRIDDTLSDLGFVAISKRTDQSERSIPASEVCIRVDMSVTILESHLDCLAHLIGFGLPRSETNAGHLIAGVEREDSPKRRSICGNDTLLPGRLTWCPCPKLRE